MVSQASLRSGFVLGLHRKMLDSLSVTQGDDAHDLRFNSPTGFDFRLFGQVKPLGYIERNYMRSLQNSLST